MKSFQSPLDLFASDSSSEEIGISTDCSKNNNHLSEKTGILPVNQAYASKYDLIKRKQELQRLSSKHSSGPQSKSHQLNSEENDLSDANSSSEDEDGVLLTPQREMAFALSLYHLRKNRNKKKEDLLNFDIRELNIPEESELDLTQKKKKKKFLLKDEYQRMVSSGNMTSDTDNSLPIESSNQEKIIPISKRESMIRENFLKASEAVSDNFDLKIISHDQPNSLPSTPDLSENQVVVKNMLEKAFNASSDQSDDKFLVRFFSNELWKGKGSEFKSDEAANDINEKWAAEIHENDEEEFYRNTEKWEKEYQERKYRYQEGAVAMTVETFPRVTNENNEGLLRRLSTTRRDARLRRQERFELLEQKEVEELKRLKHLKKLEIEDQRRLIQEIAGLKTGGDNASRKLIRKSGVKITLGESEATPSDMLSTLWSEKDLNEEFNPEEFDKKMNAIFNDDYYNENNVNEDEIMLFEEDFEDSAVLNERKSLNFNSGGCIPSRLSIEKGESNHMDDISNHNSFEAKLKQIDPFSTSDKQPNRIPIGSELDNSLGRQDDQSENALKGCLDIDPDAALLYPSLVYQHFVQNENKSSSSDETNTSVKIAEAQKKLDEKVDEYWKLHYDKISADGTLKTRFKYRSVTPMNFTLSPLDILLMDDRQLNTIAPLSFYATYRNSEINKRDLTNINKRRRGGFRVLETERSSRRYGDLKRTVILDPNMDKEKVNNMVAAMRNTLKTLDNGEVDTIKTKKKRNSTDKINQVSVDVPIYQDHTSATTDKSQSAKNNAQKKLHQNFITSQDKKVKRSRST